MVVGYSVGLIVVMPALWMALPAGLALAVAWFARRDDRSQGALHLAALLLAAAHASLCMANPSSRSLARIAGSESRFMHLDATVVDEPIALRRDDGSIRAWRVPLRLHGVRFGADWRRASGRVEARWRPDEGARLVFGMRVLAAGVVTSRGDGPASMAWFRAQSGSTYCAGRDPSTWFRALCLRGRAHARALISIGIEGYGDESGLLQALMLGYRSELGDRVYDAFSRTGTLHVVAISGSHLVMLGGIVVALLRSLGLSRTRWVLFLGPALLLYVVATGMSSSAVRALVMSVVYWFAMPVRRQPDGLSALAAAALLILAVDPLQLADAGFQLSFLAVGGLIVLQPAMMSWWAGAVRYTAWAEPLPGVGLGPWRRRLLQTFVSLCAASVAAWIATTPMTARVFNLVSPVGLVLNLVVIPWSGLVLFTGCLSMVLGTVNPIFAEVFNHANRLFIDVLLSLVELCDRIPYGHVYVPTPSVILTVLPYIIIAAWLALRPPWRRRLLVGTALAVALVAARQLASDHARFRIGSIDGVPVGFLDVQGARDVLVGGTGRSAQLDLERWVRGLGVDRLGDWIVPVSLVEVAGCADRLIPRVGTDRIWLSAMRRESPSIERVRELVRDHGGQIALVSAGSERVVGGSVDAEVFHPGVGHVASSARSAAMVVRFSRGSSALLWIGHMSAEVETTLLHLPRDIAAPIVVLGSLDIDHVPSLDFLRTLQAGTIVIPSLEGVAPSVRSAWLNALSAGAGRVVESRDGFTLEVDFPARDSAGRRG